MEVSMNNRYTKTKSEDSHKYTDYSRSFDRYCCDCQDDCPYKGPYKWCNGQARKLCMR